MFDFISTAVDTIAIMWIVVASHEFGHFAMAVVLRQPVSSVRIGYGPPLWSIQRRGIHLRVFMLPFDGAVTLAFRSKKRWKNIAVIAAGPAVNIITAAVVIPLSAPDTMLRTFAAISLMVGIFNLLPVKGRDGSQIWKMLKAPRRT